MKAITLLCEKGEISDDIILMVNEMYIQKATQYQSGEYVGVDNDGGLYKGVVAFMIAGLKKSIPYVVQALPEVTFNGTWLAKKISENIKTLSNAGFYVRAVATDNHCANVNVFSPLKEEYNSDSPLYIEHPSNHNKKTYLFFDNIHLVKNIRNNLLMGKKFVFPPFGFEDGN